MVCPSGSPDLECRAQATEAFLEWRRANYDCCDTHRAETQCTTFNGQWQCEGLCTLTAVPPATAVSVGASSVTLTLDQAWGQYSGTTALTWEGGSGASVTLVMAEFAPASGPALSSGDLRARTTAGLSSWTVLAAATSYTVVPAASTPGTETVSWAVRDLPSYSTGTYSATATFTISEP